VSTSSVFPCFVYEEETRRGYGFMPRQRGGRRLRTWTNLRQAGGLGRGNAEIVGDISQKGRVVEGLGSPREFEKVQGLGARRSG